MNSISVGPRLDCLTKNSTVLLATWEKECFDLANERLNYKTVASKVEKNPGLNGIALHLLYQKIFSLSERIIY